MCSNDKNMSDRSGIKKTDTIMCPLLILNFSLYANYHYLKSETTYSLSATTQTLFSLVCWNLVSTGIARLLNLPGHRNCGSFCTKCMPSQQHFWVLGFIWAFFRVTALPIAVARVTHCNKQTLLSTGINHATLKALAHLDHLEIMCDHSVTLLPKHMPVTCPGVAMPRVAT